MYSCLLFKTMGELTVAASWARGSWSALFSELDGRSQGAEDEDTSTCCRGEEGGQQHSRVGVRGLQGRLKNVGSRRTP
jgi:hypothetical protein